MTGSWKPSHLAPGFRETALLESPIYLDMPQELPHFAVAVSTRNKQWTFLKAVGICPMMAPPNANVEIKH